MDTINCSSSKEGFPSLSVDSQLLYNRLIKVGEGSQISYHELSSVVGRDVTGSARHLLTAARRIAQRENRIVFNVIRGEGLVRLDDSRTVDFGSNGIRKIRRVARKNAKILTCVKDFDAMPNETKLRHNALLSLYGAVGQAMKPKSLAALDVAVKAAQDKLPSKKTLEIFIG